MNKFKCNTLKGKKINIQDLVLVRWRLMNYLTKNSNKDGSQAQLNRENNTEPNNKSNEVTGHDSAAEQYSGRTVKVG